MSRGLLVSHRDHIGAGKGGVQACTQEFIDTLRAAGIELDIIKVQHDTRPSTRAFRQLNASPYFRPIGRSDLQAVADRMTHFQPDFLFLNQVALSGAVEALQALTRKKVTTVALSHGCEITDLVHTARLRRALPLSSRLRPSPAIAMSRVLRDEMRTRPHLDGVVAISPFDADMEAWFGTRRVVWVPRTIRPKPLDWRPDAGSYGYVGTLDHAPNLEGLVAVLNELKNAREKDIRVRVVGGPERIGAWLTSRFESVDYLGPLGDEELRTEASKWRAFIHPIFCLPRGCSTKLATALEWAVPIITTPHGRRGYTWSRGACTEADTPATFVSAMRQLGNDAEARTARQLCVQAADSAPTIAESGALLKSFLAELGAP